MNENSIEEITDASLLPVINAMEQAKNSEVIDSNEILKKLSSPKK